MASFLYLCPAIWCAAVGPLHGTPGAGCVMLSAPSLFRTLSKRKTPPGMRSGRGAQIFFRRSVFFLLCYIVRQRWAALIFLFRYCRKASKEGKTGPPITAVISASSSSYMASCVGPFAPVLSRSARISQNVAINPVRVASLFQSCFISKVFFRLYNPGSKIAVSL